MLEMIIHIIVSSENEVVVPTIFAFSPSLKPISIVVLMTQRVPISFEAKRDHREGRKHFRLFHSFSNLFYYHENFFMPMPYDQTRLEKCFPKKKKIHAKSQRTLKFTDFDVLCYVETFSLHPRRYLWTNVNE
jgi:hypothetical protein